MKNEILVWLSDISRAIDVKYLPVLKEEIAAISGEAVRRKENPD